MLTERENEATIVDDGEGNKLYKDAAGKTFKMEASDGDVTTHSYNNDGKVLNSSTKNASGEETSSSSNTYNDQGQRTSRTYTSNGQTYTSNYTYNENGTLASETVTDKDGNVVEESKYDKNGNEISFKSHINDGNTTTDINYTYNKKGGLATSDRTITQNTPGADGSKTSSHVTETFNKNGGLNTRFERYNGGADGYRESTQTFRKDGTLKSDQLITRDSEGTITNSNTKYRGSGITRKSNNTKVDNIDGTTTTTKTKFNMDNQESSVKLKETDEQGKTTAKGNIMSFNGKDQKVPSGFEPIKGYENHFFDTKNQKVVMFVQGNDGKPKPIEDNSTTGRLHEARLKRQAAEEEQ